jgi:hypothetical protein
MRLQTMRLSFTTLACALLLAWPQSASAQATDDDGSIAVQDTLAIDASVEGEPVDSEAVASPSGAFLLGAKIGGIASFNGLHPFVHGGIELGYVFPTLNRGLGAYLQVEYSVPTTEGSVNESFTPERVPSGGYDWKLVQKELVLQPTFLYRMTWLSDSITPFVGLGLRVYLLESITTAEAGDQTIEQTTERSTKWGGGLPIGAEFALGPGALTGEVLLQWGPLKHTLTGATHLGGVSVFAGYRMLL